MSENPSPPAEPRYGWVMVAVASSLFGMASGSVNSISVFLIPLVEEFGWLRGEAVFAYTAGNIAMGLCGIGMGWLAGRYSVRPIVLVGTVSMGLALLLLASQTALWEFYLLYILIGLGFGAIWAPLLASLGGWFHRNKGLAVGIATAGQMFGGGLVPYLARYMISYFGWRSAYRNLGFVCLGVLVPMSLLARDPPDRIESGKPAPGQSENPEERPLFLKPWIIVSWLSAAIFIDRLAMGTAMIHVVPLAQDRGIEPQSAASILLFLYGSSFLSRIVFGKIADQIGGIRAWMLVTAILTLLVFWFTKVDSLTSFYLLAIFLGLFNASATTCIICVQELAPVSFRAVGIAVVSLFGFAGVGFGGWQGGIFFDLTGSYIVSFANAAFAGAASLTLLASLYLYVTRHQTALAVEARRA